MSFFEIFNPGMRHLREERDRQNMLVSKPTIGGGAPLGIDLEGGKAKITLAMPASTEQEDESADDAALEDTEFESTAPENEGTASAQTDDSDESGDQDA